MNSEEQYFRNRISMTEKCLGIWSFSTDGVLSTLAVPAEA
jgi:hypothetical protein